MDKGMGHTEAAMDALKWTFNYGEITPLIRKVRSSPLGAPFITFQSKVIPLMAEAAIKHPLRVGKWAAMGTAMTGYALDKLGMSEEEWEGFRQVLPNYLQGRFKVPMPYRGEDGALRMLDMGWLIPGLGDMNEVMQRGAGDNIQSLLLQSPITSIASTLATKKKSSGAPLYYDWEEPGTKAMKTLTFLWQVLTPSLAPGNFDWNLMQDALAHKPEALSPWEAVAAQLGVRMIPVDEAGAYRRHRSLQKLHEGEANALMRRELRKSGSDDETRKIIDSWQNSVLGIRTEGRD
jgi:hypothetical protein